MYEIELPLLGFEDIKQLEIKKIDEFFSTLVLNKENNINFTIVNISYLEHASFDFSINDDALDRLHIRKREDFDIYFCVVMQDPVEKSIVNLVAPILINNKFNLVGQYVIKEKIPRLFTNLRSD